MNHSDHLDLLRPGISAENGAWADLGSGAGAFTRALAELLGPDGEIYTVDKDPWALREQKRVLQDVLPGRGDHIRYLNADFTQPLDLPPLDGIVMANALHFQRRKEPVLQIIRQCLRPGGRLILVEYNTDRGNVWVPYPLSYNTWEVLASRNGFVHTQLLKVVPSSFLGEIYSALSLKPVEHAESGGGAR
ncbi:MAG: class I SAM-dependent methyltransferase [Chloroflexota bacterium]|nr:MAG: class I SAM-dependent methyltransferase [Chloroflexota bacterium]